MRVGASDASLTAMSGVATRAELLGKFDVVGRGGHPRSRHRVGEEA